MRYDAIWIQCYILQFRCRSTRISGFRCLSPYLSFSFQYFRFHLYSTAFTVVQLTFKGICVRLIFLTSAHYAGWIYFYDYFIYRSLFDRQANPMCFSLCWFYCLSICCCYFGWSHLCKSPSFHVQTAEAWCECLFRRLTEWAMTSAMTTIFDFVVSRDSSR